MTISTAITKIQQRKIESVFTSAATNLILTSAALILIFNIRYFLVLEQN